MPRTTRNPKHDPGNAQLPFEDAARVLKALGHPLRLRLICGLSREPSSLTRIVSALDVPLSTVALHLGVLRRMGILTETRRGAEVLFSVKDERVRRILEVFCQNTCGPPPETWEWGELGRQLHKDLPSGSR
jgi:DNA-binding transcriptional ArsR family regulator